MSLGRHPGRSGLKRNGLGMVDADVVMETGDTWWPGWWGWWRSSSSLEFVMTIWRRSVEWRGPRSCWTAVMQFNKWITTERSSNKLVYVDLSDAFDCIVRHFGNQKQMNISYTDSKVWTLKLCIIIALFASAWVFLILCKIHFQTKYRIKCRST